MSARRNKRTAGGKDNKGLTGKAYKALLRKQALAGLTNGPGGEWRKADTAVKSTKDALAGYKTG